MEEGVKWRWWIPWKRREKPVTIEEFIVNAVTDATDKFSNSLRNHTEFLDLQAKQRHENLWARIEKLEAGQAGIYARLTDLKAVNHSKRFDEVMSTIEAEHRELNGKLEDTRRDATCFLCKKRVGMENFCYGCERVICQKCDKCDLDDILARGPHDPSAHRKKSVTIRVSPEVLAATNKIIGTSIVEDLNAAESQHDNKPKKRKTRRGAKG